MVFEIFRWSVSWSGLVLFESNVYASILFNHFRTHLYFYPIFGLFYRKEQMVPNPDRKNGFFKLDPGGSQRIPDKNILKKCYNRPQPSKWSPYRFQHVRWFSKYAKCHFEFIRSYQTDVLFYYKKGDPNWVLRVLAKRAKFPTQELCLEVKNEECFQEFQFRRPENILSKGVALANSLVNWQAHKILQN